MIEFKKIIKNALDSYKLIQNKIQKMENYHFQMEFEEIKVFQ